ncbi:MAG: hypothetical protein DYG94_04220 [Leptolyngbya sp. PLA3]|nr:MAG: hypothetical protein EDM82_07680 [Cyanobacteria bacterium CYA]MCE7967937.1 hypothetical protein [Leptolyngbya sp. PL-A3]
MNTCLAAPSVLLAAGSDITFEGSYAYVATAEPPMQLRTCDVQAFLHLFAQQHRATDLDMNAVWEYADVVLFLEESARGCP